MKKILIALALAAVAVSGASAAELQNFFNNSVRPVASMAMNVPDSQLDEDGLKSGSVAMVPKEAMAKFMKETSFASPVEFILETKEGNATVKVWQCPGDADGFKEVLLFTSDSVNDENNVVVLASGTQEAINKMLED